MKYDITISLNDDDTTLSKSLVFLKTNFRKDYGVLTLFSDEEADPFGSLHNSFSRTFFAIEEKRIAFMTIKPSEERKENE